MVANSDRKKDQSKTGIIERSPGAADCRVVGVAREIKIHYGYVAVLRSELARNFVVKQLDRNIFCPCDALEIVVFGHGASAAVHLLDDLHRHFAEAGLHFFHLALQNHTAHEVVA